MSGSAERHDAQLLFDIHLKHFFISEFAYTELEMYSVDYTQHSWSEHLMKLNNKLNTNICIVVHIIP